MRKTVPYFVCICIPLVLSFVTGVLRRRFRRHCRRRFRRCLRHGRTRMVLLGGIGRLEDQRRQADGVTPFQTLMETLVFARDGLFDDTQVSFGRRWRRKVSTTAGLFAFNIGNDFLRQPFQVRDCHLTDIGAYAQRARN